jgi:hypothetical protein
MTSRLSIEEIHKGTVLHGHYTWGKGKRLWHEASRGNGLDGR